MMMKWFGLLFAILLMLSACHSPVYDQTVSNAADVKLRQIAARKKSDRDAKVCPALVVKPGPYVDLTPVSLDQEPSWMRKHIVIRGDELPFSYYSRTIVLGAGKNILTNFQTGLNPAVNVSMNYSGTIKGALDLLSAKSGYVYRVHRNTVMWQAFITRTFDIAFMPGTSDYLMGNASGTSGTTTQSSASAGTVANYVNSDYSSGEWSSLKGTLSIWADLEKTLSALKSTDGQVQISEATTSVTVTDRPSNVALIAKFIKNLNHKLSKQVMVKVQILTVELQNDFTFGINWDLIAKAFTNSNFVLQADYGNPIAIVPFTTQTGANVAANNPVPILGTVQNGVVDPITGVQKIPAYQVLFNALSQQGKTSVVNEPRTVAMNNQVSVIRVVNSEGYIASIQNTALAGTGTSGAGTTNIGTVTSQITPGTVITGVTIYLLPKILGPKIYLQVNADFSVNQGIQQLGTGSNAIQAPKVETQHFSQRSVIHSGDTMILAGFRQLKNDANAMQLFKYQSLGGKGSSMQSTETIILITPYILPGSV